MRFSRLILALAVAISCISLGWALAQGGAEPAGSGEGPALLDASVGRGFTYQGYLTQNGAPQDGVCDFRFKLWDAPTGGNQIGATQTVTQVALADGRFTALVNDADSFGPTAFDGSARWLEVAARCSIASDFTTLAPRQALRGVPYALGLRPGAVINGDIADGGVLTLSNSADNGWALKSTSGGITVQTARDGVWVESALQEGFRVETAAINGYAVGTAGLTGLYVGTSGNDGVAVDVSGDDGVAVGQAGSTGFNVGAAGEDGFHVGLAGGDGLSVGNAQDAGVRVQNAATGLAVYGDQTSIGVLIQPDNPDWAAVFHGDVQITGSCTGCRLATIGVNVGTRPLRPGDIVAIQGVSSSAGGQTEIVWQVAPFEPGLTPVGVVAGRMEPVTYDRLSADGQPAEYLAPRPGDVAPGGMVDIITYGSAQVHVQPGAAIAAGDRVVAAAGGQGRSMNVTTAGAADMLSSIGVALGAPDADGLVWVLVNGH